MRPKWIYEGGPLYKDFAYIRGSLSKYKGFPLVNPPPWATLPTASVLILSHIIMIIYHIIKIERVKEGKGVDGTRQGRSGFTRAGPYIRISLIYGGP